MKKKLFLGLLAAAAVTFTACQKDEVINEVPQNEEISFSTYLGRDAQTKGSIVELDDLQTGGFGVYAYYTGTKNMSAYATNPGLPETPNFMNNVQVTWHTDKWDYTTHKYWPNTNTEYLSFYAYGPFDNDNGNAISIDVTGQKPVLTYTVDDNISKHMDVLFTPAQEDKTKSSKNTEMVFQHALSRIEFAVKTADNYSPDYTINLQSVTLSGNIHPSGTLNLGGATIDWTEAAAVSKSFTIEDNREITNAARRVEKTAGTPDYIMIIPQNFTAHGNELNLNVKYNVKYKSETAVLNDVTKPVAINLGLGTAYKIVATISMDKVTFTASMISWDELQDGFTIGTPVEI